MSFDRVAPHYHWLETIAFGTTLQRARTFFLREGGAAQRVLIVGEGNGRFLLHFLKESSAEVDCVDASAAMLDLARQRVDRNLPDAIHRVQFIHSTIEDWMASEYRYDLIVTHFVLDCFPLRTLENVTAKLAQAATPTATWLVADFDYPVPRARRVRARLCLAAMYLFFRVFAGVKARALSDPGPFLRMRGFTCVQRKNFQCGMVKSEVWNRIC